MSKNQYNPDYYIHPGDHILEHLRSMNDNLVWRKFTGEDKSFLFYLIVGTASIDSMSAIKLAEWFGGSQELWLNLQKQHDVMKGVKMKLETRLLWRFRGEQSFLIVEEIVDQDIYVVTQFTSRHGERTDYYKGVEAANKVYIELRREMIDTESQYIDVEGETTNE